MIKMMIKMMMKMKKRMMGVQRRYNVCVSCMQTRIADVGVKTNYTG